MPVKNQVMPLMPHPRPKAQGNNDESEFQDDSWVNDVGPASPSLPCLPLKAMARTEQSRAARVSSVMKTVKTRSPIEHGHTLWPVVSRLSERVWQEMTQMPEIASLAEPALTELVRKRAFDLLRTEPSLAGLIHSQSEADAVLEGVVREVVGFGPLETLLEDNTITEITCIGPLRTFIERDAILEEITSSFEDEQHMTRIIENMLRRSGQRLQTGQTLFNALLPDDVQLSVVLPPSAPLGPVLTLRRGVQEPLTLAELVSGGMLSQDMADVLLACVEGHLNIVVCGEQESGRDALLNALCAAIPEDERIITIEETPTLRLHQKQVIGLVAQASGGATQRDLLAYALHLRPDRLVLSNCRGEEALAMLRAMYSGYSGSLISIHATGTTDCLSRLETLCFTWNISTSVLPTIPPVPASIIRHQLAESLDVVVYLSRLSDGTRKIIDIAEVLGNGDDLNAQSIFRYHDDGTNIETGNAAGHFEPTGLCPTFLEKLEVMDIHLPCELFTPLTQVLRRRVDYRSGAFARSRCLTQ